MLLALHNNNVHAYLYHLNLLLEIILFRIPVEGVSVKISPIPMTFQK